MRKKPKQRRSLQTLDDFYEATAQLLQSNETGSVTTNHIARRAGFSIGTLYRYFPDKQAILHAMARREMDRQETAAIGMLRSADETCPRELIRMCAGFVVNSFGGRNHVRRRLILNMVNDREVMKLIVMAQKSHVRVLRALQELLTMRAPERYRQLTDLQIEIASAAVSGTVRIATLSGPAIVEDPEFEKEIADLLERQFLRLHGEAEI